MGAIGFSKISPSVIQEIALGSAYQIVAARVPPTCSRAIEAIPPDKNDTVSFSDPPQVYPSLKASQSQPPWW
jgi:hypothetical protein